MRIPLAPVTFTVGHHVFLPTNMKLLLAILVSASTTGFPKNLSLKTELEPWREAQFKSEVVSCFLYALWSKPELNFSKENLEIIVGVDFNGKPYRVASKPSTVTGHGIQTEMAQCNFPSMQQVSLDRMSAFGQYDKPEEIVKVEAIATFAVSLPFRPDQIQLNEIFSILAFVDAGPSVRIHSQLNDRGPLIKGGIAVYSLSIDQYGKTKVLGVVEKGTPDKSEVRFMERHIESLKFPFIEGVLYPMKVTATVPLRELTSRPLRK